MKKKQDIERSISQISCTLSMLKKSVETCEDSNRAYNQLLVRRADLRKKLCGTPEPGNFLNKVVKTLPCMKFLRKEKLICDYFRS